MHITQIRERFRYRFMRTGSSRPLAPLSRSQQPGSSSWDGHCLFLYCVVVGRSYSRTSQDRRRHVEKKAGGTAPYRPSFTRYFRRPDSNWASVRPLPKITFFASPFGPGCSRLCSRSVCSPADRFAPRPSLTLAYRHGYVGHRVIQNRAQNPK